MNKKFALIGHPLTHSISSKIHHKLYEYFHMNAIYEHKDVTDIGLSIKSMKQEGFSGFNVTIPYKNDIIPFLDFIEDNAKIFGAVNTVKIENNKLFGYNTDAMGFLKSLAINGIEIKNKKIIMVGAGGSCRSIAYMLSKSGVKEVVVLNRTMEKAQKIIDLIKPHVKTNCFILNDDTFHDHLDNGAIIINTTPLGMYPQTNTCPISNFSSINDTNVLVDLIYNPDVTIFLEKGAQQGAKTLNGLSMLVLQAFYAFTIWTGIEISDTIYFDLMEWLR